MPNEQKEIPFPLELTKATFQVEILKAAKVNQAGDIINLIENNRRNTLLTLNTISRKPRSNTYDFLHLYVLAQAFTSGAIYDQKQLDSLNALSKSDGEADDEEGPNFLLRLDRWTRETNELLGLLEGLRRTDIGIFKDLINNI